MYREQMGNKQKIIFILLNAGARYSASDLESWACPLEMKKLLETHLEEEAYLAATAQHGLQIHSLLSHFAQDEKAPTRRQGKTTTE
jgi:hypothetical protein